MKDQINSLLSKLKTWGEEKVQSTPLTGQSAYSISSVGASYDMDALLTKYQTIVLSDIKFKAQHGHTELLVEYPNWLCAEHKKQLIKTLTDLNYSVLCENDHILLVSWRID